MVSRRDSCLKWSSSWSRCLYELCPVDHTSPFQKGRLKVNCQLNMKTTKLLRSKLCLCINVTGVSFFPPQHVIRLWASENSSLLIIPSECFWGILLIMLQISTQILILIEKWISDNWPCKKSPAIRLLTDIINQANFLFE